MNQEHRNLDSPHHDVFQLDWYNAIITRSLNSRKRDNTTGSSVDAKRQSRHGLPTPVRCCGTQTRRLKNHIFQPVQKYIYMKESYQLLLPLAAQKQGKVGDPFEWWTAWSHSFTPQRRLLLSTKWLPSKRSWNKRTERLHGMVSFLLPN